MDAEDKQVDKSKLNYVFNFAAPVSVKLVENLLAEKKRNESSPSHEVNYQLKAAENRILVVFVGPVTHAEQAAFDVLRRNNAADEIVVVGSAVADGFAVLKAQLEL